MPGGTPTGTKPKPTLFGSRRADQASSSSSGVPSYGGHGNEDGGGSQILPGSSLPAQIQMGGRSFVKYRSASVAGSGGGGANSLGGGLTPMSLTQTSIDIREGSARLASLGLAQDLDPEELGDAYESNNSDIQTSSDAVSSSLQSDGSYSPSARETGNYGAPSTSRRRYQEEQGPSQSASSALGLSAYAKDGGAFNNHSSSSSPSLSKTPSGLSMLMQRNEEKSSPSSNLSSGAQTPRPPPANLKASDGTNGIVDDGPTPMARSPLEGMNGHAKQRSESFGSAGRKGRGREASSSLGRANGADIEAGLRPMLDLPSDSYTERSPLLRKSRSPSRKSFSHSSERRSSRSRSPSAEGRYRPFVRWQSYFDQAKTNLLAGKNSLVETAQGAANGTAFQSSGRKLSKQGVYESVLTFMMEPVKALPAVILGILMNLLDGVSYGMIMFPVSSPVFATFGGIGVSMFFASCFVSQLVYSSRSIFKSGNGSMMIEVVPFLHVIAFSISDKLGGMENSHAVVATTMVAYALTAILTGLAFFLLGYLRLGALIEFFPRVVLIGCIGGVGAFLVLTGVEVCAGLENETLEFSIPVLKRFFELHLFILWFIPLVLAIVLRIITSSRFDHPLVFPLFFFLIPIVFYIVVFAARIPMDTLREQGWIFNPEGVNTPFYEFYTLYDFKATNWTAILETIPTQLALVFFALLHVPINVPALALSVGEDNVETDKELINHGLSNLLAGCVGTIPNYLVYTNSVLFYRVGGTTRLSSYMLAAATLAVFLIGPWIIGYLPVMIVGTLIYILGYDLLKEAVWDTYGRVSGFDYTVIWIIVVTMTYFDFVVGIGVGIVAACISFAVVSSQRQPIRAVSSGVTASSTVRRHPRQSAFLRRIGTQTRVIKLQSFLFFGTVVKVEAKIRELLDAANWCANPIRFLVLDFSLANGVDYSAAEAFLRIQRLLESKNVVLVLCGCDPEGSVGRALQNVDLYNTTSDEALVRVFANLNDALEHCENSQLRSLYSKTLDAIVPPVQQHDASRIGMDTSYRLVAQESPADIQQAFSPRRTHLLHAANETLMHRKKGSDPPIPSHPPASNPTPASKAKMQLAEPLRLLVQALGPYAPELKEDFFHRLVPYFTQLHVVKGHVLWLTGDVADTLYLLESGILRATYDFPDTARVVTESMLPGTLAGEMTFLAASKRNATVVAERDCCLWRMDAKQLADLEEKEGPATARALRQVLLRVSAESADVLMGHLITG